MRRGMDTQNQKNQSPYLTSEEAAEYLRTTPQALAQKRARGKGPRAYQPDGSGSRVLYRLADLEEWVESGALERENNEEAAAAV